MHAWFIAHGAAVSALAGIGVLCLRAGKWKLAFAPLICAAMIGTVMATGY